MEHTLNKKNSSSESIESLDQEIEQLYQKSLSALESCDYEQALHYFFILGEKIEPNEILYSNIATAFEALGRTTEAKLFLRKALSLGPNNKEITFNYIKVLIKSEEWEEAEILLSKLKPEITDQDQIYFLQGKVEQYKGNTKEAIAFYEKALLLKPDSFEIRIALASAFIDSDQKEKAAFIADEILKENIFSLEIKILVGSILSYTEKHQELISFLGDFLDSHEFNEEILYYLGYGYRGLHDYEKSKKAFLRVLDQNPASYRCLKGMADLLSTMEEFKESEEYYLKSLSAKPNYVESINNYAVLLLKMDRLTEAKDLLEKSIQEYAPLPEFYINLAKVHIYERNYTKAIDACQKALEIRPNYIFSFSGLAGIYRELNQLDEARAWIQKVLDIYPGHTASEFCLAIINLTDGNLEDGWKYYDHRHLAPSQFHLKKEDLPDGMTFWQGQDLMNKSIFIWSEQGIGDEFMFASVFHDVIERSKFVVIECSKRLHSLFARSFPQAFCVSRIIARDEKNKLKERVLEILNPFLPIDYAVAAGSLPQYFRKKISDFPRKPYLVPDPLLVKFWQNRFATFKNKLKIGVCWRSGLLGGNRSKYYLKIQDFLPIFLMPNVEVVNLQYGECEDEIKPIEQNYGVQIHRWPEINLKDDFENVSGMIANLDLIITAETSVGELAGALGTEVWRLTGGVDWTKLGQEKRPWYPNMTSFIRVGEDSWCDILQQVTQKLKERIEKI